MPRSNQFARLVNATAGRNRPSLSTGNSEDIIANGIGFSRGVDVVVDRFTLLYGIRPVWAFEVSRGIKLRIMKSRAGRPPREILSLAWTSARASLSGLGIAAERIPPRYTAGRRYRSRARSFLYADAVQAAGMIDLDVRAAAC